MCMKTKEEVKMSSSRAREKPLTRLAALATLSPGERAVGDVLYKNRGNEARKLLKTKDGGCYKVQKRTQKEHVFEHKVRESSSHSGTSRESVSQRTVCATEIGGTKPECI